MKTPSALLSMLLLAHGVQCIEHVENVLLIFHIDVSEFLQLSVGYIALDILYAGQIPSQVK